MKKISFLILGLFFLVACTSSNPETTITPPTVATPASTPEVLVAYRDLANKYELKYFREDYYPDGYLRPGESFALLLDINTLFAGKNLEEVRVNISVNPDCRSIEGYSTLTSDIEAVELGGVGFTKYFARDAGTNTNTFEHTTYQIQHADNCYELNIRVREYVLEVFPELSEYSKDLLNTKLDPVIQSFRFLD